MRAQHLLHQHTSLLCSGLRSSLSIMRYKPRHRTPKLFNEPQNICPKVLLGWGEKRGKTHAQWHLKLSHSKHWSCHLPFLPIEAWKTREPPPSTFVVVSGQETKFTISLEHLIPATVSLWSLKSLWCTGCREVLCSLLSILICFGND